MFMKQSYILCLVLTLVLIIGLQAQVDPGKDHLKHLWTFEDGTANDQVGNANGDFNGDFIFIDSGDLITIPNADGVADSWLDLPGDEIDLASYNEISVSAWFTPDTNNIQWNTLWFFGDNGAGAGTGSDGISLQPRRGDGHARFWFTAGVPAGYNAEDGVNDIPYGNYNKDTLYHVVCQVNSNSEIMMYHNGVLVGTTPLTTNPATGDIKSIADISLNFARFCHGGYAADIPWLGKIHEIAIFNKALSDEEIAFLFDAGVNGFPTAVENKNEQLPKAYSLLQNYPNPFNPSTTIRFSLPVSGFTSLKVYDMLGKEIATLVYGMSNAGEHSVEFNASHIPSGTYFYTFRSGSFTETKKMLLVK